MRKVTTKEEIRSKTFRSDDPRASAGEELLLREISSGKSSGDRRCESIDRQPIGGGAGCPPCTLPVAPGCFTRRLTAHTPMTDLRCPREARIRNSLACFNKTRAVEERPHSVRLVCGCDWCTYGQLNRWVATKLAYDRAWKDGDDLPRGSRKRAQPSSTWRWKEG
jgi:hypothetical protein